MDLKAKATTALSKAGKAIDKRSPEILLTLGVISFAGAVGTAIYSTLKADSVLDDHIKRVDKVKNVEDNEEITDEKTGEVIVYTPETKKKLMTLQYVKTGAKFARLYAPTIIFTTVGLTCFLSSFGIMKKRNAALAMSLSAVRTAFDEYRGRVVRDLGETMDEHFLYDTVEETREVETVDEEGKKHKKKEKVTVPTKGSIYDQLVDESHDDYSKNSTNSYLAMRSHLLMVNSMLRSRGHLYLNRALEEFRFPETDALQAGIIFDPDRPAESKFLQIRGIGTVREAKDGTLYIDDSTMNPYWRDIADGRLDSYWVQFENLSDNIRDDVVRKDPEVRVLAGPTM